MSTGYGGFDQYSLAGQPTGPMQMMMPPGGGMDVMGMLQQFLPQILKSVVPMLAGSNYMPGPGFGGTAPNPFFAAQASFDQATMKAANAYTGAQELKVLTSRMYSGAQMLGLDTTRNEVQNVARTAQDFGLLKMFSDIYMPGGSSEHLIRGASNISKGWRSASGLGWGARDLGQFAQNVERLMYSSGTTGDMEDFSLTRGITKAEQMQAMMELNRIGALNMGQMGAGGGPTTVREQQAGLINQMVSYNPALQAARSVFGKDSPIPQIIRNLQDMTGGQLANIDPAQLEHSLYRLRGIAEVLGRSTTEVANYVRAVGQAAGQEGIRGGAALDVGMRALEMSQGVIQSGAARELGMTPAQASQYAAREIVGTRMSQYGKRLAAAHYFATKVLSDESISGMDDNTKRAVEIMREMDGASPERRAQLSQELNTITQNDPNVLYKIPAAAPGMTANAIRMAVETGRYAQGASGVVMQEAALLRRRDAIFGQYMRQYGGRLQGQLKELGVEGMDLKSYFFESADLGEDARVQLLQDKYGLGSEEEARALESSLMSTIEGSGLERERAFLSPQQLRRQRQLRADVRERSLFARLGALQGGKRFDFATVASEVLGDKDITLAGIAEKAGFIQDSTLHRRFVAALREDKMGDRLKEWGQLKDKLRNTTDKKEQEEIAKRMAVIQTDYEKMQRDFIKENLSSEHFTEIINALNIDDKTREKILKAKKEGGTEAVHKVLDEISGKGLGLKSKDIRGPEEVKVDPQTEAVKEEMMRKYAGKGVKDKAEEGKGGGSVTVEHKWGGSAKVNILINGEHKATVELPNPESKTISSDEERAKSANKQESIEVSAGPAVKG